MKRLMLSLLGCLLLVGNLAFGQMTDVTGTVTGEDGQPVIGATVREKGTKRGVASNSSGVFTLKVKPGATLEVSAVGFESKEVAASANVSVVLKISTNSLSEVVVTGLGVATSRK